MPTLSTCLPDVVTWFTSIANVPTADFVSICTRCADFVIDGILDVVPHVST